MDFQEEIRKYRERHNKKVGAKKRAASSRKSASYQNKAGSFYSKKKKGFKANPVFSLFGKSPPLVSFGVIAMVFIMIKGCYGSAMWMVNVGHFVIWEMVTSPGFAPYDLFNLVISVTILASVVAFFLNKKRAGWVFLVALVARVAFIFYFGVPISFALVPVVELVVYIVSYIKVMGSLKELDLA